MIYEFRLSERQFPVDAQLAGEALEDLRVRSNGHITPRAVVDASREKTAPLHPIFEWDNAIAAEAHRESQAQDLMRSVVVRLDQQKPEQDPVRAFVAVRVEREPVYTDVRTALEEPNLRAQLIEAATRELYGVRKRYSQLVELADLFAQIDELRFGRIGTD